MQGCRSTKMGVAHVFKVEGNKLPAIHAAFGKLILDQVQHNRLATASDAGQHLNQLVSDERTDAVHISFSFNHIDQPPF